MSRKLIASGLSFRFEYVSSLDDDLLTPTVCSSTATIAHHPTNSSPFKQFLRQPIVLPSPTTKHIHRAPQRVQSVLDQVAHSLIFPAVRWVVLGQVGEGKRRSAREARCTIRKPRCNPFQRHLPSSVNSTVFWPGRMYQSVASKDPAIIIRKIERIVPKEIISWYKQILSDSNGGQSLGLSSQFLEPRPFRSPWYTIQRGWGPFVEGVRRVRHVEYVVGPDTNLHLQRVVRHHGRNRAIGSGCAISTSVKRERSPQ